MARRKRVISNPVGDRERYYQQVSPLGGKAGGRTKSLKDLLRKDGKRANTTASVSKYPDILDIYAMINSLTLEQIKRYSRTSAYDVLSRDLLFHFAEDWGELNRDHSGYLSQVPEGYSKLAASLIGDLLYWMITGVNERSIIKTEEDIRDTLPWSQEISINCPDFAKRMKSIQGLSIHDLRGLQIRILNNLPINSYNRYTIAQATQDDPELAEQFFPKTEPLDFDEHQTLTTLIALVDEGDIEKFSVALAQSSESKLTGATAAMTFEAFEMAKQAVDAYKRGETEQTRMRLSTLVNEYGMNLNTFQSGLKDMFVLTASTPTPAPGGGKNQKGAKVAMKGSPSPLLVSLDTSMSPKGGWPSGDMHAIMKFANQHSVRFKKVDKGKVRMQGEDRANVKNKGTLGLRAITVRGGDKQSIPALTTNWTGIFEAALNGRDYREEKNVDDLASGIDLEWPNEESISIRFIIHADLSQGIGDDYLVPKARLTVVARQAVNDTFKAGNFKLNNYGSDNDPFYLPVIDLFVEDLGRATGIADAFTKASREAALEAGLDEEEADESLGEILEESLSVSTARRSVKGSQKKAIGNAIAIDLVPKSQIEMKSITEFHPRMKYLKKVRDKHNLKEMYKHYATGQLPTRAKGGKYRWRGKLYNSKKQVQAAVSKDGTQVDKGHQSMSILYARRKDNGNLVPHRIILPKIMVKFSDGRMTANKGSKHSAQVAKLLKQIEADFGKIDFMKNLNDAGGQSVKGKDKRGKPKEYNYNRGVGKLFKAKGLQREGIGLYVSQIALNGVMHYEGRAQGGSRVGPFAFEGVKA